MREEGERNREKHLPSCFNFVCSPIRSRVLGAEIKQLRIKHRKKGNIVSFPFSFPLLEYWFGTSEEKTGCKVGEFFFFQQ